MALVASCQTKIDFTWLKKPLCHALETCDEANDNFFPSLRSVPKLLIFYAKLNLIMSYSTSYRHRRRRKINKIPCQSIWGSCILRFTCARLGKPSQNNFDFKYYAKYALEYWILCCVDRPNENNNHSRSNNYFGSKIQTNRSLTTNETILFETLTIFSMYVCIVYWKLPTPYASPPAPLELALILSTESQLRICGCCVCSMVVSVEPASTRYNTLSRTHMPHIDCTFAWEKILNNGPRFR